MISAWWLLLVCPLALLGGAALVIVGFCIWYDRASGYGKRW